ncbi:hypothetical protein L6164_003274 [Bauhinia variegata]|uniref:Uncharacterized protein n=1 Tax=Bauhinia variegata TaxID=167791 RepID=A0ACB9Q0X0_BAUVA|nr:hypothetical protein L6164_003274 [Bauhinia variegata]
MGSGILPSPSPTAFSSSTLPKPFASVHLSLSNFSVSRTSRFSNPNLKGISFPSKRSSKNIGFRCNGGIWPGGPGTGDGDNRSILDAFFLGKALAEALNERIESTVGEFLSTVGRLQAEQQKQVKDFQEGVLKRAKKAKEKAARETLEAQGLVYKSTVETTVTDSVGSRASSAAAYASETNTEPAIDEEESALGSSRDD